MLWTSGKDPTEKLTTATTRYSAEVIEFRHCVRYPDSNQMPDVPAVRLDHGKPYHENSFRTPERRDIRR